MDPAHASRAQEGPRHRRRDRHRPQHRPRAGPARASTWRSNYASSRDAARAVVAEAPGARRRRRSLLPCDVADDAAVRAMLAQVGEAFGRLDALVNNAGTTAALEGEAISRAWTWPNGTASSPSTCAACSR